jgi:pimeloyl-ACP methyl ester carboxylesterase
MRSLGLRIASEEINAAGTRTMVLIGGGKIVDPEVQVLPRKEHPDYEDFIQAAISKNWRILLLHGQDYLSAYYDEIASLARTIKDEQKPILVGHSAGAVIALDYLKDRRLESWFKKAILFNCPLVYPRADLPALKACYQATERVTTNAQLIMSDNDPIMELSLGYIDMRGAIKVVRKARKVDVKVLDRALDGLKYEHSPFAPINVAWEIVGQLPALRITLRVAMSQRFRRLVSVLHAFAEKLKRTLQW